MAVPAPRTGHTAFPTTPVDARRSPGDRRKFDVVIRGYERAAVDEFSAHCADEAAALRRELAESERRRTLAEQHASAAEQHPRATEDEDRAWRPGPQVRPEESFGFRVEELIRFAEQQAADTRAVAARGAASMLEQARAEAEQLRHEVEQNLIARSAMLDQQSFIGVDDTTPPRRS